MVRQKANPWVKGIQVRSNKAPNPFPSGYSYKIAQTY